MSGWRVWRKDCDVVLLFCSDVTFSAPPPVPTMSATTSLLLNKRQIGRDKCGRVYLGDLNNSTQPPEAIEHGDAEKPLLTIYRTFIEAVSLTSKEPFIHFKKEENTRCIQTNKITQSKIHTCNTSQRNTNNSFVN